MKVVIFAFENPEDFAKRDDPAAFEAYMAPWKAYSDQLAEAGVLEAGCALEQPHSATTLSLRDGAREVQDGPYADAKEQLGGYFLLDVPDMATAEKWAAACPAAETGRAEAHLVPDYGSEG
ncbi:MAG: YciI family protein [Pseudomonadota bacterium]